jgi:hypothetical protein
MARPPGGELEGGRLVKTGVPQLQSDELGPPDDAPDVPPELEPEPPPELLPELELPLDPELPPKLEPPPEAEPLALEPLPEPEWSPALPVLGPHEKARQTVMAAATKDASVIAVVRERLIPILSRLLPPAAQNGA